jgi:hypothetical protein
MSEKTNDNIQVLSKEESQVLQKVQENGAIDIHNSEQLDLLFHALIKVGEQGFHAVMDIVKDNAQLCKAIRKHMEEVTIKEIESNNELANKEIGIYAENSAAIRAVMTGSSDPQVIEKCFEELRFYARLSTEAQERRERDNEAAAKRDKEMNEAVLEQSKKNRQIVKAAAIGFTVGSAFIAVAALIKHVIDEYKK